MNIDEILSSWREDSKIDRLEMGDASLRSQELHAKYLDIFFHERMKLLKLRDGYNKMKRLRHEYWNGQLSVEDLKEYGWPPQPLRILKSDIELYMESDDVLSDLGMRHSMQQEKVNILQEILKSINQRNWTIRNAIEWSRFTAGQ